MKDFRDKRVLITGAAHGIGKLLAEALAERGAQVAIADRDADGASEVANAIKARGQRATPHALDVTKLSEVQTLAQELDAIGGVDVLINNAGVVFGGVFEQVSLDQHLTTLRVNVEGIVALTHAFLPQLLRAPQANIVNIASASSFIGLPYGSTYAASKWAVLGFSDSLRLELEERGVKNVKLTTVCPGYISTGMFDGAKSPLVMPLLAPDFIVAKIIQGIERDAVYVKEPLIVKTIDTVKGLLPRVVWEQATRLLGVAASMQPWKGHTVAPAPTPASLATAETPAATSGEPAKSKPARAKQRPSVSRRS